MGKDTLTLAIIFLQLSKKNHLFCKLQLFSQNVDVLHFPEDFCIYQRNISEYNNLQCQKKNVIYSKLTIKTLVRNQWHRPGVFIVNFEQISQPCSIFLLLTQHR